jgi:hypothetical protein
VKGRFVKKKINPTCIPKWDYGQLPAEFHFDRRMVKRNRFAGRVKFTHGGARTGSGRPPVPESIERHTITFYKSHAEYLRQVDTSLSKAICKLISIKAKWTETLPNPSR